MTFPDIDSIESTIVGLLEADVAITLPVTAFPGQVSEYIEQKLKSASGIFLVAFASFQTVHGSEGEPDYRVTLEITVMSRDVSRHDSALPQFTAAINACQGQTVTIGSEPFDVNVILGGYAGWWEDESIWAYTFACVLEPRLISFT